MIKMMKDFSQLSLIEDLSLKGLNLDIIPNVFTKMANLTELKLNRNKIKKIENIDMLLKLRVLDLS